MIFEEVSLTEEVLAELISLFKRIRKDEE